MQHADILITNVLDSGTAFGVTMGDGPQAVFVPGKVATAVKAQTGDRFVAMLVPNTIQPEKTPWMAARIEPALPLGQVPQPTQSVELASILGRVERTMMGGGVWTPTAMFELLYPGATKGDSPVVYTAVVNAMHGMFGAGKCAKFQLWSRPGQGTATREWFTCYPQRADVDEWEEV